MPIQRGDYVRSTINFTGQAPARGTAYPTLPTTLPGTPGLLDLALLNPKGRFAYDFISRNSYGVRSNGFVRFGDFGFNYTTRGLTYFDYQFMTDGNFTTVLRGA